jgi:transcriptional regulator with XRE-family HTH domain
VADVKFDDEDRLGSEPRMIGNRIVTDVLYHKLSRELLYRRVRAGLRPQQVAKRMGTSASAVSRMENAVGHRPTLNTLERYAKAVGCTLEVRFVDRNEAWYRELASMARPP